MNNYMIHGLSDEFKFFYWFDQYKIFFTSFIEDTVLIIDLAAKF